MTYNVFRNLLFFFVVTLIVPIGYVMGIGSNPNYATETPKINIITKAILPIENALQPSQNFAGQAVDIEPIENPFQNGKIYNLNQKTPSKPQIAQRPTQPKDPRITTIDLSKFSTDLNENTSHDIEELVIHIPGYDKEKPKIQTPRNDIQVASLNTAKKSDLFIVDAYKKERKPLLKAPLSDYTQRSPYGMLPYQPKKLMPLYKRYGHNSFAQKDKKYLSLIVGGLGMNDALTQEAIKTLPPEVTLGFIPYTDNLQKYIDLAREYGHETILEVPLESYDYPRSDVGHKVLLTSIDKQKNKDRLYWLLGRATGYSGIMNYLGGKFLLDPQMKDLLAESKKRGLYFIENKTIQAGLSKEQAKQTAAYYKASTEILDSKLNHEFIRTRMRRMESKLSSNSYTTVTAYASPLTLSILRNNLLKYKQKNIQLLPVSSTIQ